MIACRLPSNGSDAFRWLLMFLRSVALLLMAASDGFRWLSVASDGFRLPSNGFRLPSNGF